MRRRLILIGIILINLGLVGWIWSRGETPDEVPPELTMTSAHLAATPDFALIHMTYSGLRMRVVADPAKIQRWRELPDVARHALVLSWLEESFVGFTALFRREQGPFYFQADDLVEAYEALGIREAAAIVEEASRCAAGPEQPNEFADIEARFAEQRRILDAAGRLRTFIRAHLEEITSARL